MTCTSGQCSCPAPGQFAIELAARGLAVRRFQAIVATVADTPTERLAAIARNFALATARGHKVPIVSQMPDDPASARHNVGRVERLDFDGVRLIATGAVTNVNLPAACRGSSIGQERWTDGSGFTYSPMLMAISLEPSDGQAFQQCSFCQERQGVLMNGLQRLRPSGRPIRFATTSDAATRVSVADLVKMLNQMFGLSLPTSIRTAGALRDAIEAANDPSRPAGSAEPDWSHESQLAGLSFGTVNQARQRIARGRADSRDRAVVAASDAEISRRADAFVRSVFPNA